ncbi:segregation/condensation protein A [Candidatus Uhrbacteria bacterium]|nr:segregation/condensation protein A [Candidatus Uhrbacteria bacterium]
MLDVTLEQFEGPLDLLLRLIEQQQLDITEVSLARVTDEYLTRVSHLSREIQSDELADFLVVASKLILLKSRSLLPQITADEEQEIEDLARQLKIYQEFANASRQLEKLFLERRILFPRDVKPVVEEGFSPPPTISKDLLKKTFLDIIARAEVVVNIPKKIVFDTRISIYDKIHHIKELLSKRVRTYFSACFSKGTTRAEVIVSFLALLELVKQRYAVVRQDNLFEEIHIEAFQRKPQ